MKRGSDVSDLDMGIWSVRSWNRDLISPTMKWRSNPSDHGMGNWSVRGHKMVIWSVRSWKKWDIICPIMKRTSDPSRLWKQIAAVVNSQGFSSLAWNSAILADSGISIPMRSNILASRISCRISWSKFTYSLPSSGCRIISVACCFVLVKKKVVRPAEFKQAGRLIWAHTCLHFPGEGMVCLWWGRNEIPRVLLERFNSVVKMYWSHKPSWSTKTINGVESWKRSAYMTKMPAGNKSTHPLPPGYSFEAVIDMQVCLTNGSY